MNLTQSDLPQWQPLYYLQNNVNSILDVGCNVGELLSQAENLGVKNLYGIDINRHAINIAQSNYPQFQVQHSSADQLEYENESMDAITICEVIEHIPQELRANVIAEISRVLKPKGQLILTTPYRGLFHWLDPANMRLRFPWLFHHIAKRVGGKGRQHGFFGEKHGIVWHHHFTQKELNELLNKHFIIKHIRYRGIIIDPIAQYLMFPFYRLEMLDNFCYKFIRFLKNAELKINPPSFLAFNVIIVAEKKKNSISQD